MGINNPQKKNSISSRLQQLSRRERIIVIGGTVFIVLFLIYQAVIDPFMVKKQRLERSLHQKAENVLEMKLLQKQYQQIKGNEKDIMAHLQQRNPDFDLFSFLDQQISALRIKDRVSSMKPGESEVQDGISQTSIDMKIDGVVLGQLVDFLVAIESFERVVFVDRIVVRRDRNEDGLLDVLITVITFGTPAAS